MSNIREQIRILVEAQAVDVQIQQAGQQITALNNEADALDDMIAAREASVSEQKKVLDDLKKAYRELETESAINAGMVEKSNEKLRVVKTNKEYQSILKEIEEIRKKNADIDDQLLELLEAIESAEKMLGEKETELTAWVRSCQQKKENYAAQTQREQLTIDTLNEKKVQISAEADPKILALLDEVKKRVRGMAVVPAVQATCMGCHMNIPPQLFNELQRCDEIRFCPHCQRIIYWQAADSE